MTDHQLSRRSALIGLGGTAAGAISASLLAGAPAAVAAPTTTPATIAAPPATPQNSGVERRVSALLRRMTLAEKLGQLQLLSTPELAQQSLAGAHPCGGVFSVVGAAKLNVLQRLAVQHTRLGIPLIFGLDVIHGYTTNFPIPLGQASSFDPGVASTDAVVSAAEARRSGITWTYAPMMDVTHEPRWGRIAEGAGEDPYLASQIAVAKVQGYQGNDYSAQDKLAACAKHYVAYGGAEGGRDYNTVDVSIQELHNHYLPPFKASVAAGVATVMASFNAISGVPAHANAYVLREILKGAFGFDGFVVSDYTGIQELILHGVAGDGADAAAAGITAGVDMEMVSTNYVDFGSQLLVQGRITRREIDDAVRRILGVKFALGLFEHPYVDESTEVIAVSDAARASSRAAAGRSMVLMKNDNALLPLALGARIAVIGPLATATYDLNGTWSGLGTGAGTTPPVTVLDGIKAAAADPSAITFAQGCDIESADTSGFAAAAEAAAAADVDVVVLALGESAAMSGEASARSNINLPGVQEGLLAAVVAAGKPVVVVLFNGRPLTLQSTHDTAAAILEAWAPGVEGGNAVADVLFGKVNPGGKLPVSFPRAVGQVPIYYNHLNTGRPADPANKYTSKYLDLPSGPLYSFGFGLSYTTFTLSAPRLSSTSMNRRGGRIDVSVDVQNTGVVAGDEVVQLYLHDPVASIAQPVRRLRGFRRVTLEAGQSTTVTFTIGTDDVGFYDNQAKFVVETGTIEVYVGNSSDADQSATFTVV